MFIRTLFFLLCVLATPSAQSFAQSASWTTAQRIRIEKVIIEGNKRTRTDIILREMSVFDGMSISVDSIAFYLEQNRQRVFNLAIFTEVKTDTVSAGKDIFNFILRVKERWVILPEATFQLADRNFNVWWTEQNRDLHRANFGLSIKDHNFRGNLEELSGTVQIGYTQKFSAEYYKPYIDKNKTQGLGCSFSYGRNQEIFYTTDSNKLLFVKDRDKFIYSEFNASVLYSYRKAYATKHVVALTYMDNEISREVRALNPDFYENRGRHLRMLQLYYRFDINKTDNWNYPLRGFKLVSTTMLNFGITGMRFQGASHLEAALFKSPLRKWFTSAIIRARISLPEDQPYALRSALGTRNDYVRGYEYYVADGSQFGIIRFDLKRELINHTFNNIPLRYLPNIPVRIYPKLFLDAGYARNIYAGNSFLNNRMLYSAGFGLDLVTAYDFKLRVECAINHLGQTGLFLHMNSE